MYHPGAMSVQTRLLQCNKLWFKKEINFAIFWDFVDSRVVSGIPSKEGGRVMSYLGTVVTTTPALYWLLQYKRNTKEIQMKYKWNIKEIQKKYRKNAKEIHK